ncbi:2-polyprenyl-6-methoxyphenol hydroxylase-like FAD-dependent oxidoreductase [Paenarthrobacter nitroguajacolicus]|uniref:FAD-dependent oxidoreductase n=1 Tax=Paenarthrobacter nitroguajacolicus TaxID=211146 RepID=UPI0028584B6F|nr:FAD-dependent oxidoreductase [Paenarthrobacter nitroguajacolicus]MDR6988543.1 2-polyprenyl-6-methoxyphenol hydroxylase-like FAD-dependent oxidoreductase [Paenarthrobacter nitroguajacolicus]
MAASTQCVVVGGGPAGIVLGLLLARAGVRVTVLEKHADFLRDFRGDTVHASTIRLLDELGLGEGFRALPQSRLGNFRLPVAGGDPVVLADFGLLKEPYNYVAMVPQWDLLNFLVEAARQEPTFTLLMNTEATDLLRDDSGAVGGVRYQTRDPLTRAVVGGGELRASLTVACDGRGSVLRSQAGLVPREFSVPFDTWWFRLPRHANEDEPVASIAPRFGTSDVLLSLTRKDYHQIAYLAAKGLDPRLRAEGVEAFRGRVARLRTDLADRVGAIESMDDLHLLDVKLNRLSRWHKPGLLLIGDAAHAMSPAGGVGINLAVQDAVAAARILASPLLKETLDDGHLAAVQKRRWLPTLVVQTFQRILHRVVFAQVMAGKPPKPPKPLIFALRTFPAFGKLPARMIAFGPRPEHAPEFARRKP